MIKSLLVTTLLAYSQVNFSNTPILNEPQKAISESIVQEGIANYEITLEQNGTTTTTTNSQNTSYRRLYNQTYTYMNIQAESIFYDYWLQDNETESNIPGYGGLNTGKNYPYYKISNWNYQVQPQTYNYSQYLVMMQITPYYVNLDNEISNTTFLTVNTISNAQIYEALAYPPDYVGIKISKVQYQYDLFTSTYNWANYMGTTTWSSNGYTNQVFEEISTYQSGYNYNHKQDLVDRAGNNTTHTIDFNIIPNQTNYLFLFITPILTLQSDSAYPTAHAFNQQPQNMNNTMTISGTGIIPTTTTEVIDVPGLMFDIISLPWYFISTAFNLTLFPGTQYQLNISNLFLAVIAVFIFIFLLKLVTGKS